MAGSPAPLVSAIIPAYNAERTLREAVDSALAQTYPNIEIIIVDDGSADGTSAVIQEYAGDARVRSVWQRNAGAAAARNRGIAEARGEYLAFLDADDLWLPEKTEKQLALFRAKPHLGLVYCRPRIVVKNERGEWIDAGEGSEEPGITRLYRGRIFRNVIGEMFITMPSVMIPLCVMRAVGGFCEDLATAEDRHLYARVAHNYEVDYVDEVLLIVRRQEQSLSWNSPTPPATLKALRMLAAEFPECSLSRCDWMRRAYAHWAHRSGYDNFYAGNMRHARQELWEACRYRPFRLSSWGYLAAAYLPKPVVRALRAAKRRLRR